jgi:hypothetical protein
MSLIRGTGSCHVYKNINVQPPEIDPCLASEQPLHTVETLIHGNSSNEKNNRSTNENIDDPSYRTPNLTSGIEFSVRQLSSKQESGTQPIRPQTTNPYLPFNTIQYQRQLRPQNHFSQPVRHFQTSTRPKTVLYSVGVVPPFKITVWLSRLASIGERNGSFLGGTGHFRHLQHSMYSPVTSNWGIRGELGYTFQITLGTESDKCGGIYNLKINTAPDK